MRQSLILLAAGGGLLVVGFVMLATAASRIAQDAEDNTFFSAILTFSPLEEKSTAFTIVDTRRFYLIASSTDDVNQIITSAAPVAGKILDPEGHEIVSIPDVTKGILRVDPKTSGIYSVVLKNQRSDEGTQVLISATYASIPTTGSDTLRVAPVAVVGTIVMMVGLTVVIAGAILFIFEWKRFKNKNTFIT